MGELHLDDDDVEMSPSSPAPPASSKQKIDDSKVTMRKRSKVCFY